MRFPITFLCVIHAIIDCGIPVRIIINENKTNKKGLVFMRPNPFFAHIFPCRHFFLFFPFSLVAQSNRSHNVLNE